MRNLAVAALVTANFLVLASPVRFGFSFLTATALLAAINIVLALWIGRQSFAAKDDDRTNGPAYLTMTIAAIAALLLAAAARAWLREILTYPNDAQRADMLIVIQHGIRRMLQGDNPYTIYQVPWEATLPYGPAMWVPYVAAHLLHADVRFVSLLGALFVPGSCAVAAVLLAAGRRHAAAAGALLMLAAMAWSPELRGFASIAHTPVYWPLIALFAWLVARRRWTAAAVACGLLVVARTTMIAIVPVFLVAVWRLDRERFRVAALCVAAAALLPYLPFALWDPQALTYALYGSYQSLMKGHVWSATRWAHDSVGITGLLLRLGRSTWVEPMQILVMLVTYAAAWRAIASGRQPLPWMVLALFAFSATALWPVNYVYFDVFMFWIAAALSGATSMAARRIAPLWSASLAAAVTVTFAAVSVDLPRDPVVDVGAGISRPALYRGFSSNEGDERTFAWVEGTSAQILVPSRSRRNATIEIVCQPHLPTRDATQAVSVTMNGVALGTVPLRHGWQSIAVYAPSGAWTIGVNQLTLTFANAVSPFETGTGDDRRKLSAAVDRVAVRTQP